MRREPLTGRCRPLAEADAADGIIARLRDVIRDQPDKVAVADATSSVTYADLASAAAAVHTQLRQALAALTPPPARRGPEEFTAREPIAVLFGHEIAAVAAMVAVLASGHPLLVLDPSTPAERLGQLADRLGIRLIVSSAELAWLAASVRADVVVPSTAPEAAPATTPEAPATTPQVAPATTPEAVPATTPEAAPATTYGPTCASGPSTSATLWDDPPDPGDVAVVAFTSGSTGAPKPVANDHRLLVRDAWNSSIATGCYDDQDVLAHTLPLAFHAGLTTTLHGLLVGATMHLYDTRSRGVAELPAFIRDRGCTVLISAPAVIRAFCSRTPEPALLRSLRRLTIAGEPAPTADVLRLHRLLPRSCVIRNRYGASETGLITEYVVDPGTAAQEPLLPAGRGVGWTVVELVDRAGRPVPEGAVGRIRVRAPSVALGYWGLPEESAAAFGIGPDGLVTFLTSDLGRRLPRGDLMVVGRADHAVKIRGYLVDPGEVDAVLHTLPGVRETATVSTGPSGADGEAGLVAYVAVDPAAGLTAIGIRAALARLLPAHLVPARIQLLDELPRNDRGKIDRVTLARGDRANGAISRPSSPPSAEPKGSTAETDRAESWTTVLHSCEAAVLGGSNPGARNDARGVT